MRFYVLVQVSLVGTTEVAYGALIRALTRVRPHVLQEIATLVAPVGAMFAKESTVLLV